MTTLRNVAAVVMALSTLAATPVASAREHHHVRRTTQYLRLPGFAYTRPRPSIDYYHDTPSYDDPSKNGCCG
jgi:hypothetical protein